MTTRDFERATAQRREVRQNHVAALDALMQAAAERGQPLNDTEGAEFDRLMDEIKAIDARVDSRVGVEYQIAGLEQELQDGLARLERADQADDHVAYYRRVFDNYVRALRRELDSPTPDIHQIAVCAMQAAWLARIWPVLQTSRLQRHGPNLKKVNRDKQVNAATKRDRCLVIARTLKRPTPATIRDRYLEQFGKAPELRTIRRYLATLRK